MGRPTDAIASLQRAIELDGPEVVHYVSWLGSSYAIAGRTDEAHECLVKLESLAEKGASVGAWMIPLHAALGNTEEVMQCLLKAFDERSASLVFHLTHQTVDCVRDDPRFIDLLKNMDLEHLASYRPEPLWTPQNLEI